MVESTSERPAALESRVDRRVVVIGAGHNGLVAAFYLARGGLEVTVVEAQSSVGGACKTEELIPGFRFSTCANVVCWLRPEVARDLRLVERGVTFSLMDDPSVHCYDVSAQVLPDGSGFAWWADPVRLREEISRFSLADAEAWPRWEAFWNDAASILGPYIMTPPPTFNELVARAQGLGLTHVLETVLTTSIAELADRYFESPIMRNHVIAPHDMGSVYDVGTGLARALETAVHSYRDDPTLVPPRGYVRGGMGRLTLAMAEAAREEGATILTAAPVRRILTELGRATGVVLADGSMLEADIVVSNADIKRTFLKLLAPEDVPEGLATRVRNIRTDIAPLKLHCALSELPRFYAFPDSDLPTRGSFFICPDREYHESAWDDARHGRLPNAPIIRMMTPSTWDDSLAPAGSHTASFWILFAPTHLRDGTWPERRAEMADRLIEIICRYSPNFADALVGHVLLTPFDLEERVLLTDGNIHHVDISPSQMLWQRPLPELAGYRTPISGLYLCGAGMHPYGEVTGAPGHNSAHVVLRDVLDA
jgi:phytoene dehydrogenase-like protein